MITEKFTITLIKGDYAYLKKTDNTGCGSCDANSTCGVGILTKYFSSYKIRQPLQKGQKIGDVITLKISEKELFYRATQLYILPLLALFLGAIIAKEIFPAQDIWQIVFGSFGFCLSFILLKFIKN